jgi:TolB-like protein
VPAIAVLPFTNMSGDKEQEYFSDGLAEEIINALAQIPGLKVTARASAFSFKGKDTKVAQIANELGVEHILEGSIRKGANRIRITAQLIGMAEPVLCESKCSFQTRDNRDRYRRPVFSEKENRSTAPNVGPTAAATYV